MPKAQRRKVLVSIPTEQHAERLKLEGVLQYAHEKNGERWDIVLDVGRDFVRGLDGIVAYVRSEQHRRQMLSAHLPTVLIEDLLEPKSFPRRPDVVTLLCDHVAEGRTAARYFLDRHFAHFAFIGTDDAWSRRRGFGFSQTLEKSGHRCRFVGIDDLNTLPKPCAVFAAHDILARRVLAVAEERNLAVPDELSVLGVDDDEVMCTTSAPALSSIPTFDCSLGYAAGRALNEIFMKRSPGRVIRTRHAKVVTRTSTQKDAIDDPFVARMLDWARAHLADKLDAESLSRHVGYSKRGLQVRTEQTLGATLGETIRRLRMNAVEDLLANTDTPIGEIAARCGFTSVSHLSLRLKAAHGVTPFVYRRMSRSQTVASR